jgi:Glycosyl hydrolase family 26
LSQEHHKRRHSRALGLLLASITVSVALMGCGSGSTATVPNPGHATLYWGARIAGRAFGAGHGDAPWNRQTLALFERDAGKGVSIIHFARPWKDCMAGPCRLAPFPQRALGLVRAHGAIPLLDWGSWALPGGEHQPAFSLSRIIGGAYDTYIARWARAAKAWGHPFFLRFDWEMNLGCCWAWAATKNGNSPQQYVAMWRHVHDIFAHAGATNVTWVWCPNVKPLAGISALYPGDRYVDWTCLDGYNWGTNPNGKASGWISFASLFGPAYSLITKTIAPTKPLIIGEIGSSEVGGSKADWIADAFGREIIDSFPRVKAVVYFNSPGGMGMDWPIESSSSAKDAFARMIGSSAYAPNRFGSISTSPIPPLH